MDFRSPRLTLPALVLAALCACSRAEPESSYARAVESARASKDEMLRKSGQTKAPTLDWYGEVLADFGVEELVPFLRQRNVKLEDS